MAFFVDPLTNSLIPVPAGEYGFGSLNGPLLGQGISQSGEVDIFRIDLVGATSYAAAAFSEALPGLYVEVYDPNGILVGFQNSSFASGSDPFIEIIHSNTFSSGTYTFLVTDLNGNTPDRIRRLWS